MRDRPPPPLPRGDARRVPRVAGTRVGDRAGGWVAAASVVLVIRPGSAARSVTLLNIARSTGSARAQRLAALSIPARLVRCAHDRGRPDRAAESAARRSPMGAQVIHVEVTGKDG